MDFRLGAKGRTTGVYNKVNEDCEDPKATTPKIHLRRIDVSLLKGDPGTRP
jgi:hypothetical protein